MSASLLDKMHPSRCPRVDASGLEGCRLDYSPGGKKFSPRLIMVGEDDLSAAAEKYNDFLFFFAVAVCEDWREM